MLFIFLKIIILKNIYREQILDIFEEAWGSVLSYVNVRKVGHI